MASERRSDNDLVSLLRRDEQIEVRLSNGDLLRGAFIRTEGRLVAVETEGGGLALINLQHVQSIRSHVWDRGLIERAFEGGGPGADPLDEPPAGLVALGESLLASSTTFAWSAPSGASADDDPEVLSGLADERAGTWDRTRILALLAWRSEEVRSGQIAVDLLRSIPSVEATPEDCANLVLLFLENDNKKSAANAARPYFERVGRGVDLMVDPVARQLARRAVDVGDPQLMLRALPGDAAPLVEDPTLLRVYAAVQWQAASSRSVLRYRRNAINLWEALEAGGDDLRGAVRRVLEDQERQVHAGWHPFEGASGRDLVGDGLGRGKMHSWKGEYGFIADTAGVRRFVHRTAVADPTLRGRPDEAANEGLRVKFELRTSLFEGEDSQRRLPVCHAVVLDVGVPAPTAPTATAAEDGGAPAEVPASAPTPDASEIEILAEVEEQQVKGDYKPALRTLENWVRQSKERGIVPSQAVEARLSQLETFVDRVKQMTGIRGGDTPLDRALRAIHVERDLEKAERFLLESRHDPDCETRLAACKELASIYSRRAVGRMDDIVDLLTQKDVIACVNAPRDVQHFYYTLCSALLHLDRGADAEQYAREGLERLKRYRGPRKAVPDATLALERALVLALLEQGRPREVIGLLTEPQHAGEPTSQRLLGQARADLGEYGEAESILTRIIDQRPDDSITLDLLAQIRGRSGAATATEEGPSPVIDKADGFDDVDLDGAASDRFVDAVRRLTRQLKSLLTHIDFEALGIEDPAGHDDEESDAAERLRWAIRTVGSIVRSDRIHEDTRSSFSLEALIALDRVGDVSHDLESVAGQLIATTLEAAGLRVPPDTGRAELGPEDLDALEPLPRRLARHLVLRARRGRQLVPSGAVGADHVERLLRRTAAYRRAVDDMRQDLEVQADPRLTEEELSRFEEYLRAAAAYTVTGTDRANVDRARDLLRLLRAASFRVPPMTRGIDPWLADDIEVEIRTTSERGGQMPTFLWNESLGPLLQHLHDTCRAAKVRSDEGRAPAFHVDTSVPLVGIPVRGRTGRHQVHIPVVVRNPLGVGAVRDIGIEGVLEVGERGERIVQQSRVEFEGVLEPEHEVHLTLTFDLELPNSTGQGRVVGVLRDIGLSYSIARRRGLEGEDGQGEATDVEGDITFDLLLLEEDEFDGHQDVARKVLTGLKKADTGEYELFGRGDEISKLGNHFTDASTDRAERQVGALAIIYGLQQTGKTTLARRVWRSHARRGGRVVHWDIQAGTYDGDHWNPSDTAVALQQLETHFFRRLVDGYRMELGLDALSDDVDFDPVFGPERFIRFALDEYRKREGGSPPLPLFFVDEFTRILSAHADGRLTDRVLSIWRTIAAEGLAHVLLVGHGNFEEIKRGIERGSYPFFSTALIIRLRFLDAGATRDVCTEPFSVGGSPVQFTIGAVDEVFAVSAGHARTVVDCVERAVERALAGHRFAVTRADVRNGLADLDLQSFVNNLTDPQLAEDLRADDPSPLRALRSLVAREVAKRAGSVGVTLRHLVDEVGRQRGAEDPDWTDQQVADSLDQLVEWSALERWHDMGETLYRPRATILRGEWDVASAGIVRGNAPNAPRVLECRTTS